MSARKSMVYVLLAPQAAARALDYTVTVQNKFGFGAMIKRFLLAMAGLILLSPAHAALVQGDYLGTFSGNDSEAALMADLGFNVTLLAKVDTPATSDDGLAISDLVLDDDDEPVAGEWSYSGQGLVDYLVIKAGPAYAVYQYTDANTDNMRNMGLWDTSGVGNKGLSHITAYQAVIPVPAAGWLFLSGLAGLGLMRRSK